MTEVVRCDRDEVTRVGREDRLRREDRVECRQRECDPLANLILG